MLTIRLSRVGKKKQASFKVIISEKSKDTKGDYLELLGYYNPHTNKAELKADRIKYWLGKGAQTSGTIHNLLIDQKIISGEKIKVANIKKKSAKDGSQPRDEQPLVGAKTSGGKEEVKSEVPAAPKTQEKPTVAAAEKPAEQPAPPAVKQEAPKETAPTATEKPAEKPANAKEKKEPSAPAN